MNTIQQEKEKHRQFRFRETVGDLRFDYYCRVTKSGLSDAEARAELREPEVDKGILNVAEAITQGKILPIMLFYRCFIEWKR